MARDNWIYLNFLYPTGGISIEQYDRHFANWSRHFILSNTQTVFRICSFYLEYLPGNSPFEITFKLNWHLFVVSIVKKNAQTSAEEGRERLKLKSNKTLKMNKGAVKILKKCLKDENQNFKDSDCIKMDEM